MAAKRVLMADRLTGLLTADLAALEAEREDNDPADAGPSPPLAVKARVEAVSQITRTLEKLLELRRLESLALEEESAQDEAETVRLREELLRRLRAVDARRAEGPGLLAPEAA